MSNLSDSYSLPRVLGRALCNSFKNIARVIVRPVSTVRNLGEEPDYLAPLLLIFLVLLVYSFNVFVISLNVKYDVKGTLTSAWTHEVEPILAMLMAGRLLNLIFGWFTYFFLLFIVSRFLGSDKELYPLFTLSGLILHIFLIQLTLNAIILLALLGSAKPLYIKGLYDGSLALTAGLAYNQWTGSVPLFASIKKLVEWFSFFWGATYTFTVLKEERELSSIRALLGTVIIYPINAFIALFFATAL